MKSPFLFFLYPSRFYCKDCGEKHIWDLTQIAFHLFIHLLDFSHYIYFLHVTGFTHREISTFLAVFNKYLCYGVKWFFWTSNLVNFKNGLHYVDQLLSWLCSRSTESQVMKLEVSVNFIDYRLIYGNKTLSYP